MYKLKIFLFLFLLPCIAFGRYYNYRNGFIDFRVVEYNDTLHRYKLEIENVQDNTNNVNVPKGYWWDKLSIPSKIRLPHGLFPIGSSFRIDYYTLYDKFNYDIHYSCLPEYSCSFSAEEIYDDYNDTTIYVNDYYVTDFYGLTVPNWGDRRYIRNQLVANASSYCYDHPIFNSDKYKKNGSIEYRFLTDYANIYHDFNIWTGSEPHYKLSIDSTDYANYMMNRIYDASETIFTRVGESGPSYKRTIRCIDGKEKEVTVSPIFKAQFSDGSTRPILQGYVIMELLEEGRRFRSNYGDLYPYPLCVEMGDYVDTLWYDSPNHIVSFIDEDYGEVLSTYDSVGFIKDTVTRVIITENGMNLMKYGNLGYLFSYNTKICDIYNISPNFTDTIFSEVCPVPCSVLHNQGSFRTCDSIYLFTDSIDYDVVGFGSTAFFYDATLKELELPESIEYISDSAFQWTYYVSSFGDDIYRYGVFPDSIILHSCLPPRGFNVPCVLNIPDMYNRTTDFRSYLVVPPDCIDNYTDVFPDFVAIPNKVSPVKFTKSSVYVEGRFIYGNSILSIYNVKGQNVTLLNGRLDNGVYIVVTPNESVKVIIK